MTNGNRHFILVDFDGTCVDHCFPDIGTEVPNAVAVLRELVEAGHHLILWTMRSGTPLQEAVDWFQERKIPLADVNKHPTQYTWTDSPKPFAHFAVDDTAIGCPLRENPRMGGRPFVDWSAVRDLLVQKGLLADDTVEEDAPKIPCQCCGKSSVGDEFDICENCWWEQDPLIVGKDGAVIETEPSLCNDGMILADAREAYRRLGAIEERFVGFASTWREKNGVMR